MGWVMIAALVYSVIPPIVLGRIKQPLARELHDWLSGLAGVFGIGAIAFGLWWADSAAAAFISIEIIKDGWGNLRNAIAQLMNKSPSDVDVRQV